ncbi:CRISPR-associated endoribonuclease Cas2 [Anoxybacillus thermarum]|uniref:CRISPR-associated endoribonuclease Cas2 n=2 Tax=Anoxybacillus thermarum TaxID=404937 RepID=A0A0D0RYV8_9BACL|nr:CRISPR-associated endoribonuclease Cas2 [Anoxybacillus thermarum]
MLSDKRRKKFYIVCYDIEDTKRRTKLAKWLCNFGVRVQKSVFEAYLHDADFQRMLSGAEVYVGRSDSLRIYELTMSAYRNKVVRGEPFEYEPFKDVIV